MQTTVQFLDAVRARHGLTSDYQLAKFLGVKHATISGYRHQKSMMDEAMCLKIAAALGIEPGEVLVAIAFEREKRAEVKSAWQRVAQRLASVAGAVVLGLGLGPSLHNPSGGTIQPAADQTTHMRQTRRRRPRGWRQQAALTLSALARYLSPTPTPADQGAP